MTTARRARSGTNRFKLSIGSSRRCQLRLATTADKASANLWVSERTGFATGFERFVETPSGRQRRMAGDDLRTLHDRQVEAVRYLDGVFARLFDILPSDTWVVVTSDHGELFGEERFFGHGPIMHEKVLEVPFVEGMVP